MHACYLVVFHSTTHHSHAAWGVWVHVGTQSNATAASFESASAGKRMRMVLVELLRLDSMVRSEHHVRPTLYAQTYVRQAQPMSIGDCTRLNHVRPCSRLVSITVCLGCSRSGACSCSRPGCRSCRVATAVCRRNPLHHGPWLYPCVHCLCFNS